jgi:hypothetical protein
MWVFTPIGFFSVVQKRGTAHLTVRARVLADLDGLRKRYLPSLSKTVATPSADYPFRATVSHADWGKAMARMSGDVNYHNFKSEVERVQGAGRAAVYHAVWAELLELQRAAASGGAIGGGL